MVMAILYGLIGAFDRTRQGGLGPGSLDLVPWNWFPGHGSLDLVPCHCPTQIMRAAGRKRLLSGIQFRTTLACRLQRGRENERPL